LAYDAAERQMVLFGGQAVLSELRDTWTWNGITWSRPAPGR
jgi:hypothetical protein